MGPTSPVSATKRDVPPVPTFIDPIPAEHLDRVSFHVPPGVGLDLIEAVPAKYVDEVWINPGSEPPELVRKAEKLGPNVVRACSILDPRVY